MTQRPSFQLCDAVFIRPLYSRRATPTRMSQFPAFLRNIPFGSISPLFRGAEVLPRAELYGVRYYSICSIIAIILDFIMINPDHNG